MLSPQVNQCILSSHMEAVLRAGKLTGVVSGSGVTPVSGLTVRVAVGKIRVAGAAITIGSPTDPTLDAADATHPRVDIIYRAAADGAVVVAKGTAAEAVDPSGLGNWKGYTAPSPPDNIPDGVILAAVFVDAEATTIESGDIWDISANVPDVLTTVGSPGTDVLSPTEKAVRTALGDKINTADIVTSVGETGSDAKVPSEQAVREAIDAVSAETVTGGDAHDHTGGAGAQIDHGGLGGRGDDDHSQYHNDARGDARYAPIAKGVTGGDSHSALHKSGGGDAIKLDDLAAPDDNTDLNVSTSKHGLMPKLPNNKTVLQGDGTWTNQYATANFQFGDGSAVVTAGSRFVSVPKACKIIAAEIRSTDANADLKTGSITFQIFIHDYNADADSVVASDTFSLASASSYQETGLSIAVADGKYITCIASGVATVTQVGLKLKLEAT